MEMDIAEEAPLQSKVFSKLTQDVDLSNSFMGEISNLLCFRHNVKSLEEISIDHILEKKRLQQCYSNVVTVPLTAAITGTIATLSKSHDNYFHFNFDVLKKLQFDLDEAVPIQIEIEEISNEFPIRVGFRSNISSIWDHINDDPIKKEIQNLGYIEVVQPSSTNSYPEPHCKPLVPKNVSTSLHNELIQKGTRRSLDDMTTGCLVVKPSQLRRAEEYGITENIVLVPICSLLNMYLAEKSSSTDPLLVLGNGSGQSIYSIIPASKCIEIMNTSEHLQVDIKNTNDRLRANDVYFSVSPLDFKKPNVPLSFAEANENIYNLTAMGESPDKHTSGLTELENREFTITLKLNFVFYIPLKVHNSETLFFLDPRFRILESTIDKSLHVCDSETHLIKRIAPWTPSSDSENEKMDIDG